MLQERAEWRCEKADLDDQGADIVRVIIEDEKGRRAVAFLGAKLVRGRVKFKLVTLKNDLEETHKEATADWIL